MSDSSTPRPGLRAVDGGDPDEPLVRRARFEAAHPDITIMPPETHASPWTAWQGGQKIASAWMLGGLLDALEARLAREQQ